MKARRGGGRGGSGKRGTKAVKRDRGGW